MSLSLPTRTVRARAGCREERAGYYRSDPLGLTYAIRSIEAGDQVRKSEQGERQSAFTQGQEASTSVSKQPVLRPASPSRWTKSVWRPCGPTGIGVQRQRRRIAIHRKDDRIYQPRARHPLWGRAAQPERRRLRCAADSRACLSGRSSRWLSHGGLGTDPRSFRERKQEAPARPRPCPSPLSNRLGRYRGSGGRGRSPRFSRAREMGGPLAFHSRRSELPIPYRARRRSTSVRLASPFLELPPQAGQGPAVLDPHRPARSGYWSVPLEEPPPLGPRFERAAKGLDTGHRSLLVGKVAVLEQIRISSPDDAEPFAHAADLHRLAAEFQLSQTEILDLIQSAPRLKKEFDLVAACLHPRTEHWELRYALTADLDQHDGP
jgi:hypothetical protein